MQRTQYASRAGLQQTVEQAARALGYIDHIAAGANEPHARTPMPANAVGGISLRDMAPPLNPGIDGSVYMPQGSASAKLNQLSHMLLANSVVANAGAQIILIDRAPAPAVPEAPAGALYARNYRFDVVKPAGFSVLADGASASESALPIARAAIDLDAMPTYSFKVSMTRSQQKLFGLNLLSAELERSITLGIARVADAALLKALEAASLAPFTLGAAAAVGVHFPDLRAIVGSAGTGAAANLGDLYVSGIRADLTMDATSTLVGTWQRAAVAVHEDVRLLVDRRSVQGDMTMTIFVNAQPLLPDHSYFWHA